MRLSQDLSDGGDFHRRICLWAVVDTPAAGPVLVATTHLSLSARARARTIPEIAQGLIAVSEKMHTVYGKNQRRRTNDATMRATNDATRMRTNDATTTSTTATMTTTTTTAEDKQEKKEKEKKKLPIILSGDFNCEMHLPNNRNSNDNNNHGSSGGSNGGVNEPREDLPLIQAGFRDAWVEANPIVPVDVAAVRHGATFNTWEDAALRRRIDYIYIHGAVTPVTVTLEAVTPSPIPPGTSQRPVGGVKDMKGGLYPSDHAFLRMEAVVVAGDGSSSVVESVSSDADAAG